MKTIRSMTHGGAVFAMAILIATSSVAQAHQGVIPHSHPHEESAAFGIESYAMIGVTGLLAVGIMICFAWRMPGFKRAVR